MQFDETFWVMVAFLILVGILVWAKVPGMIAKALDQRGDKIRADLDQAAKLRAEAQAMHADYQKKQQAALAEAEAIVATAEADMKRLAAQAEVDLAASITRRKAQAEAKIAQAEAAAIQEVRNAAVDIAVEAARTILAQQMSGGAASATNDKAIAEARSLIN